MKNPETLFRIAHFQSVARRWLALSMAIVALSLGAIIGCSDEAPLTGAEFSDQQGKDGPDSLAWTIEPDVTIERPRHWLAHRISTVPPVDDKVALMGQFDQQFRRAYVRRMQQLINPAMKIHNGKTFPIVNEDEHFTAYQIRGKTERRREVLFENQFGRQVWIIGQPRVLYVPAQKQGHSFPDKLDHYKCYEVLNSGNAVNAGVGVKDQFTPPGIAAWTTAVREGKLFCVPSRKIHGNNAFGVKNAAGHLAVYEIGPIGMEPVKRKVRDQFARGPVKSHGPTRLIVESRKVAWHVMG